MIETILALYLFNTNVDFDRFADEFTECGFNTIITSPFVFEKAEFQRMVKKRNLQVVYNFPVFCNTEYLNEHPESYCITSEHRQAIGADWLQFVCPTDDNHLEFQKKHLSEILDRYDPKIVSLDFIRHYVFWEKVYPEQSLESIEDGCYCDGCLDAFEQSLGKPLEERSKDWIYAHHREQWAAWKCHIIEHTVAELTGMIRSYNPDIQIGIKIVPWRESDFGGAIRSVAGQDVQALSKYFDFFVPMTYSHMVKQEPRWIQQVVDEIHTQTGKSTLSCLQMEKTYLDTPLEIEEFRATLSAALEAPAQGTCVFHYDVLGNDIDKNESLKTEFSTLSNQD